MDLASSLSIITKQLAADSVYFPNATLTDLYNTAQRTVSLLVPSIIKSTTISLVSTAWMYRLPTNLIRIKDVYHSTGYFLTETPWEDMDLLSDGQWEGISGVTGNQYQYWLWLRPYYLIVGPVVFADGNSLTVYYYAETTDISGSQQTDIPDQYENALNLYTRALALISDKKFNQATPLLKDFFDQINLLGKIEIERNIGVPHETEKPVSR